MTDKVTRQELERLFPFGFASAFEIDLLADRIPRLTAEPREILIEAGSVDSYAIYVLKGDVLVRASDDEEYVISGEGPHSERPVSHLVPHRYTVISQTRVEYIKVDNALIDKFSSRENYGEEVLDIDMSIELASSPLFIKIWTDLKQERLLLPAAPGVARKIAQLDQDKPDAEKIEALISADPATSAWLLKVANSTVCMNEKVIDTLPEAIQRSGLETVCRHVTRFVTNNLFKSRVPWIRDRMKKLWVHSTETALIAMRLALETGFDPDKAMMAGLLHDIGALPILTYAEKFPELVPDAETLDQTLFKLHAELGGVILQEWGLGDDLIVTAGEADDWFRQTPNGRADICDVVLIAQLHSFLGKTGTGAVLHRDIRSLPVLSSVPAFKRLGLGLKDPGQSLNVLRDAHEQMHSMLKMIS